VRNSTTITMEAEMMEAEITEDVKQPTSNIASPNLKSAEMSEKYVFFFFDRYPTIYPSPPIRSSWLFYCQEMRARETSTGCRLSPKKASLSFLSPLFSQIRGRRDFAA